MTLPPPQPPVGFPGSGNSAIDFTQDQLNVLKLIRDWFGGLKSKSNSRYRQVSLAGTEDSSRLLYIGGYAGVGKTTLIKYILEQLQIQPHRATFCTYTGKAALVMSDKTGYDTSTVHSAIYHVAEDPLIPGRLIVQKKREPDLLYSRVVFLDEVSMIDKEMMADLLSYGVPIICFGDPFQLPPIGGDAYFSDDRRPDYMMTQITRNAIDSPIIWISKEIREGRGMPSSGSYDGGAWIGPRSLLSEEAYLGTDQILVGYNNTRVFYNDWMREKLGFAQRGDRSLPVMGEKLICLKNNKQFGVVNGQLLTALDSGMWEDHSQMKFRMSLCDHGKWPPELFDAFQEAKGRPISSMKSTSLGKGPSLILRDQPCFAGHLWDAKVPEEYQLHWTQLKETVELTFATAITVHKAQGSQFDRPLLINEPPMRDPVLNSRWQYTGITRAVSFIGVAL